MADPQNYRLEAERIRREASVVNDPYLRRQLLDIAAQYDRLAVTMEGMARDRQ
jgi:hypothetical protein